MMHLFFFQVAHYGPGGHYYLHPDNFYPYKEPELEVRLGNLHERPEYLTGDRMATFMLYLSEVESGGLTAFPRLGVAVAPERNSGVFWHNLRASGRADMSMLHGGCPVLRGSKWVANKWVREGPNGFARPCGKDRDD